VVEVEPRDLSGIATSPLRPFGRYILLNQLGEGGMARVYTAVIFGAEGFRRKFVVKRLRPELLQDPSVVAQFIDEANMASHLVHSNIVPVLDFGKVDDEYFLATEYILGRDLGRLVQRSLDVDQHGLPPDVVLFIAQEVLKALEYAHGKTSETGQPLGIVHRDVSPSNVLVSARGEVKLFDFGIVKAEGRQTRTQQGVVKGNVSFISPEQARGTEVDQRADLFSLGLVLYTCLAGEVLYAGNSTYELLIKAASGPGVDEIQRLRRMPSPLGAILEKVLNPDPAKRFQTASEFLAAVTPHVGRGGSELSELVTRLFADDFRHEEAGFANVGPPTKPPLRASSPDRS
jgi:serine/threonine protein kinase